MLKLNTCINQDGTVQQDLDLVSSLSTDYHVLVSDLYLSPTVLNSPLLLWEILGINSHSDKTPTEIKYSKYSRFVPGSSSIVFLLYPTEHYYQSLQI